MFKLSSVTVSAHLEIAPHMGRKAVCPASRLCKVHTSGADARLHVVHGPRVSTRRSPAHQVYVVRLD